MSCRSRPANGIGMAPKLTPRWDTSRSLSSAARPPGDSPSAAAPGGYADGTVDFLPRAGGIPPPAPPVGAYLVQRQQQQPDAIHRGQAPGPRTIVLHQPV